MNISLYVAIILIALTSCNQIEQERKSVVRSGFLKPDKNAYITELKKRTKQVDKLKPTDIYAKLALLYTKTRQCDSALFYANLYLNEDSNNVFELAGLFELVDVPGWKQIEVNQLIKNQRLRGFKYSNPEIVVQLWRMSIKDQAYYDEIAFFDNLYGNGNKISDSLNEIKRELNAENLKELSMLLDKIYWPKISEYGSFGASAAFLIIQHSDALTREKYLPVLAKTCDSGEASYGELALLTDRTLVDKGKEQIYGTQLHLINNSFQFYPIADSIHVDERRKKMGLIPLKYYFKLFRKY